MFVTTDAMVVFLENWCIREQGFLACSHLLHSLFALTVCGFLMRTVAVCGESRAVGQGMEQR